MEGKNIAKNGLSRLILKKKLHFLKNCKMTEYHFNRTPYKPADGMLAGFSLFLYVPIAPAYFAPYTSTRASRIALYNMPKMDGLFLCNFLLTSCDQSAIIKMTYG